MPRFFPINIWYYAKHSTTGLHLSIHVQTMAFSTSYSTNLEDYGNMAWTLLFVAGLLEICWTIGLKYSDGFTRLGPTVGTLVAMATSFGCFAQALRTIPVGTGYAV
jgi:Membrane transporters of cations and cationic drugs